MKKRAFTLLELLTVIAIISVLSIVGSLSIRERMISNATLRLYSEVGEYFRSLAKDSLESGRRRTVTFDLTNRRIISEYENATGGEEIYEMPAYMNYAVSIGSDNDFQTGTASFEITGTGNSSDTVKLYAYGEEGAYYLMFISKLTTEVRFFILREFIPSDRDNLANVVDTEADRSITASQWQEKFY